ncbi:MAG: energy transducer TonB family protein [Longimicrobiales bacterium]
MRRTLITCGCALAAVVAAAGCGEEPAIEEPTPMTDLRAAFGYPVELWDAGLEGQTILMVHIDALGQVDSSFVATSSGHAAFDSAALVGIVDVQFMPARQGGERIPIWIRLPVRFNQERPSDRPGAAAGRTLREAGDAVRPSERADETAA